LGVTQAADDRALEGLMSAQASAKSPPPPRELNLKPPGGEELKGLVVQLRNSQDAFIKVDATMTRSLLHLTVLVALQQLVLHCT
jgi:hypothetical protein